MTNDPIEIGAKDAFHGTGKSRMTNGKLCSKRDEAFDGKGYSQLADDCGW
jgi:hypothetical protein